MAKPLVSFLTFFALLLLLFAAFEMPMADAKTCTKRSRTWFGLCLNSNGCNRQCKKWEGAKHGACHAQFQGTACFCYYC
ncbi:hypothetical protein HHK36_003100 [Tetracentron sinense]|uniref:Knottins-like domain-containing protein n=1 Tax=Tetracentron sinense TaxID=13715 RepID=A0A835DRR9_TETSI|nr:hypothetical protein HHK36_003100 [Tetracentron sinense]